MSKSFAQWLQKHDSPSKQKIEIDWLSHYRNSPPEFGDCRGDILNMPGCLKSGLMSYVYTPQGLKTSGIPAEHHTDSQFELGYLCESCLIVVLSFIREEVQMRRLWHKLNPGENWTLARRLLTSSTENLLEVARLHQEDLFQHVVPIDLIIGEDWPVVQPGLRIIHMTRWQRQDSGKVTVYAYPT